MGRIAKTVLVSALLLASVQPVDGQRRHRDAHRSGPGGVFGVSFVAADAVGDFGTVVDQGFGAQFTAGFPMAADGHLRLRADLGFVVYGLERLHYCGISCRVTSELTTTNNIVHVGIGPEVVFSSGPVQPYLFGTAGGSFFVTSSSLDDHDGYGPYLQTTNYSDGVYSLKYGGGLRMRVGGHHRPVFIDLGVERHDNGIVDYLTRGDIVDNPDGTVTLFPNRSDADLVTFRLGVAFRIH
ncbi:MAG: hypothetical protein OEN56_01325 [Gemmatimonadota bacterium]|nr:hypothetical protein [Gemmatimonadota bacterium]